MGFSYEHSLLVANVRNWETGYISPQFHLVSDDLFEKVICQGDNDPIIDAICNDLFEINRNWYAGEEIDDNHSIYQPPPLDDVWLDESGHRECNNNLVEQKQHNSDRVR